MEEIKSILLSLLKKWLTIKLYTELSSALILLSSIINSVSFSIFHFIFLIPNMKIIYYFALAASVATLPHKVSNTDFKVLVPLELDCE